MRSWVALLVFASVLVGSPGAFAESRKFALALFHFNVQYVAGGVVGFGGPSSERSPSPTEDLIVTESFELLAAERPDELTVAFRIARRGGRVFLDWLRNLPGATVVAPYSLRATPRATVATPTLGPRST